MLNRVKNCGVVPVVAINDAAKAVPTAEALLAGGIDVIEVTFRTDAAEEAIRQIAQNVPDMLVGAGTVINAEQLERAEKAGAKFIVTPGLSGELVDLCKEKNLPIFPGVVTPSEIMEGLAHGVEIFKFFPASVFGGLKAIKALGGPFPQLKFMPTGGVNPDNLPEYLESDKIFACGGSWMVKASFIDNEEYAKITELSREAREIVKRIRG